MIDHQHRWFTALVYGAEPWTIRIKRTCQVCGRVDSSEKLVLSDGPPEPSVVIPPRTWVDKFRSWSIGDGWR